MAKTAGGSGGISQEKARKGNSDGHVKGNMSGITRLEKRGGQTWESSRR